MSKVTVSASLLRESLISSQERKRERIELADSIVADDINKLPDFNVTDALSRISGIQIDRERGEGNGSVAIRGLNQTESLLNGREIFSAEAGTRTFNMSELPSEMLAGIDVYKSAAANIIEGGLGGTIDVRLRRPFDFKGMEAVASVRGIYGNLVDDTKFQYSLLFSDRFKVGQGEIGFLINATYQERDWREDFKNPGTPQKLTIAGIGDVLAPNGSYEGVTAGSRERSGVNAVIQWVPVHGLEIYAEGSFSELKTYQETYGTSFALGSATPNPASVVLFPGTKDVASVTYSTGATFSTYDTVRDTIEKHRMFAIGAKWKKDALFIKADLSYTDAYSTLMQEGINTGNDFGALKNFTLDTRGKVAATTTDTNLGDTSKYKLTGLSYIRRPYDGDMLSATVDSEYKLGNKYFTSLLGGLRYATRNANNENGMANQTKAISGTYAQHPDLFKVNPYPDYFTSGNSAPSASWGVVHGNEDLARGNIEKLRNAFGITDPLPAGASNGLMGRWDISEDTATAYLMSKFQGNLAGLRFDGAAGVRYSRTEDNIDSARQDKDSGGAVTIKPLSVSHSYDDVLPSINTRWFLQDNFFIRAAASKTLTRPSFPSLAPSLSLTQMVDPTQNTGSAGNPALKPIRAWNYDLTLEKYFTKSASAYVAFFYKDVDGFISNAKAPESYDGVSYTISRPMNLGKGKIKGFELGGQMFLDFMPGWLSGFGVQANYTYVDSSVDDPAFPTKVPLNNLSENSYNLILMYEYKKFSARVAYNWRDKFYNGSISILNLSTNTTSVFPQYISDYGWLDASVSYSFTKRIRVSIDGTNLLNTIRTKYLGTENFKNNAWVNDVQVIASVTVRL